MSKQREALKLALGALDAIQDFGYNKRRQEIIQLVSEALAEPEPWTPDDMAYRPGGLSMSAEQEPVAWMMVNEEHGHKPTLHWKPQEDWHITWKAVPLYTAPPARKPLTDEEIDKIIASNVTITDRNLYGAVYMAIREVEAAHGIGGEE